MKCRICGWVLCDEPGICCGSHKENHPDHLAEYVHGSGRVFVEDNEGDLTEIPSGLAQTDEAARDEAGSPTCHS